MSLFYEDGTTKLYCADNRAGFGYLSDDSFDSCVTDSPYELGFMGRKWDRSGIAYNVEFWSEVFRVMKPGAHLLNFGGTRTYHRMACAIEDAGFEIRDQLQWVYGQGFPKSLDIGRAIDTELCTIEGRHYWHESSLPKGDKARAGDHVCPLTQEGDQHRGEGTALKPSNEPICLARKPFSQSSVAANALRWGTGGLNIDASRIGHRDARLLRRGATTNSGMGYHRAAPQEAVDGGAGRFPSNLILGCACEVEHDEGCAVALLDAQSGHLQSGKCPNGFEGEYRANVFGKYAANRINPVTVYGDSGGASRFFYVAKASKAEREQYLHDREAVNVNDGRTTPIDNPFQRGETKRKNTHTTVKPISLMRYLCRLVTPQGGTVFDPFTGSGTTGIACVREGFNFVGCERELEYAEIAAKRIAGAREEERQAAPLFESIRRQIETPLFGQI